MSRVGWATSDEPLLVYRNLIAKPRKERSKKDTIEPPQAPQLQVGNDVVNIEAVRFQLKTQFDRNVVTHFEAQEHLFDYAFTHLGIDTENSVQHPIVLTEAFLNPNTSRQFLASKTIFENTRRLNTGGWNIITFLHRILQLKYPAHAAAITLSRAEELLHTICEIALDYREELSKWQDSEYYERNIKKNSVALYFVEQQKERKRELARRLTEINARKREERLAEDQEKLRQYLEIQELIEYGADKEEIDQALSDYQVKSIQDLQKNITNLNLKIEKTKQKILAANSVEEVEEPPTKQSKYSKMVFENEIAQQSFLDNVKRMRQEILNKKMSRKQRKQDIFKRRTAAGQERMRIISQLARKEKGNDDFGLRDEDWDIYKTISKDGGDSDSEAENEKLLELEEIVRAHEPSEMDDSTNPGETHQLHIGVECFRASELLFKPYMAGSSEAGLSEVIGYVLSLFSPDNQLKLASNVIVVGGLANLKGLRERLLADLISIRPFKSKVNVTIMGNSTLTAWYGAKKFAQSKELDKCLLTRKMYDEYGPEYFKMHVASNPYFPTPKEMPVDVDT
ncbi:hypothetical protein NQ317_002813 [Molorchus minor]|uniref:Actin-related protein 5 n=1 Tax=Molorchus minor TaxID=1323400 RepID=A0ABQ9JPD8_9CUCU|nr:hypothetical protein NQ317_002813 [Molorchus minor]